jgi:hypothetical protein
MESTASQPGLTKKPQGRPAQSFKGRRCAGHSEGSSNVDEATQTSPPRVEPTEWQQAALRCVRKAMALHHPGILILSVTFLAIVWWSMMASQPVPSDRRTDDNPPCHREVPNKPPTRTSAGRPVRWADYPQLVYLQTRTFDQLLDESVDYKRLAREAKEVEMASDDLVTLVRASDLGGKAQIAKRLDQVVDYVGKSGCSLHSLGARIQGAVDS